MNSRPHQQFNRNHHLTQAVLRVMGAHAAGKKLSEFAGQQAVEGITAMAQEAQRRGKRFAESNKHSAGRVSGSNSGHAGMQATSGKKPRKEKDNTAELSIDIPPRHSKPQKDPLIPITESLTFLGESLAEALNKNDFSQNLAENPTALMKCLSGLKIKFTQAQLDSIIAETIKSAESLDDHTIATSEFSPHTVTALLLDAIGQHSGKHAEVKQRFLQSPFMAEIIADHHAHALGPMAHTPPSPAMEKLITLQQERLGDLFDYLKEGSRRSATIDKRYAKAWEQAVKEAETPPPPPPLENIETLPPTYHSLPAICEALREKLHLRLPSVTNDGARVLDETLTYPNKLQELFPDEIKPPLTAGEIEKIVDSVVDAHNHPDTAAQNYLGDRYLIVVATRCLTDRLGVRHVATQPAEVVNPCTDIIPYSSPESETHNPSPSPETKDDKKTAFKPGSTVTWIAAASLGIASIADFFGIGKPENKEPEKEGEPAKKESGWLNARNMVRALVLGGAVFLAVQASKGKPIGAATAGLLGRSSNNTEMQR